MARRIGDSHTAALAAAKKDEALETDRVGHRFKIAEISVKRQVFDASIRKAASSTVVACAILTPSEALQKRISGAFSIPPSLRGNQCLCNRHINDGRRTLRMAC